MSDVAARVLDGTGEAFQRNAGPLLPDVIAALVSGLQDLADLAEPDEDGWAPAFDLDTTPAPAWLGAATGTPVPASASTEQARTLIRERPAWRRGTPAAMMAAVRAVYPIGMVAFLERDGSPWTTTIRLYSAAATPEDQARVLAAAARHKPVGVVLAVELVSGASYAHLIEEAPTYAALAALYPTYHEMRTHLPEEGTTP